MNTSALAAGLTAALAVAAGVAIGGLPSDPPGDLVVSGPIDSTTTVPAAIPVVTSAVPAVITAPTTESPVEGTDPVTEATTTSDSGQADDSAEQDQAVEQTDTTRPDDDPADIDTADDEAPRASLRVGSANAGAQSGVASSQAERLVQIGYSAVQPVDAANPTATSTVYFSDGFDLEASRLAVDLGWGPLAIAPMTGMPAIETALTFDLVAMIGLDLAPPT